MLMMGTPLLYQAIAIPAQFVVTADGLRNSSTTAAQWQRNDATESDSGTG